MRGDKEHQDTSNRKKNEFIVSVYEYMRVKTYPICLIENNKTSAFVLICVNAVNRSDCQTVAAGVILLKMYFVFKIRI